MARVSPGTGDVILITQENADEAVKRLPLMLRAPAKALARVEEGSLRARIPSGERFEVRGPRPGIEGEIDVKSWRFFRRLLTRGDVGLGESFMAGEWDSPDPTAFLELFARNLDTVADQTMPTGLAARILALQHFLNRNSRGGARRNIAAHYDLGNRFYESWLDPSVTYSSALFSRGANDLETAQRDKYRAMIEAAGIGPDHHVLEIGCGWGGFAEYAAREVGCRVTGLTISAEQKAYAEARLARQGLSDRVSIELTDYREATGTYDRIVSIEMFEAVGERWWPEFFRVVNERLGEGGRASLQIITIREDLFEGYRRSADFIQKYIFPGGMLPPLDRLGRLARSEGLEVGAVRGFGQDYARTLVEWRARFLEAWPKLPAMGFDERFRRMWLFYLHFCEAGFRAGTIDVNHLALSKA